MEGVQPAAGWAYVLRSILAPLIRSLPGWILKMQFGITKCKGRVVIMTAGVGPHIYVNPRRSPAIGSLELIFFNLLPFPIAVDGLRLDIYLESTRLATCDKVNRVSVGGGEIARIALQHDLTDSQAEIVRQYPEGQPPCDCPTLRINGEVQLRTPVGDFSQGLGVETRAFVYRG